jgi:hypothetical protein
VSFIATYYDCNVCENTRPGVPSGLLRHCAQLMIPPSVNIDHRPPIRK